MLSAAPSGRRRRRGAPPASGRAAPCRAPAAGGPRARRPGPFFARWRARRGFEGSLKDGREDKSYLLFVCEARKSDESKRSQTKNPEKNRIHELPLPIGRYLIFFRIPTMHRCAQERRKICRIFTENKILRRGFASNGR